MDAREHGRSEAGGNGAPRIALVQGASRGLGLAFARALLERGDAHRVVATSRDPDASAGLAALHGEHGEALLTVSLDVRDEVSLAAAADRVEAECGPRLHWLINCAGILHDEGAGIQPEKKLEDVDPERLRAVFEVNAFGPLLVAKHFARFLRHDQRAVLANLSARVGSIGDNGRGGWYAYRASKAAQNMFTRTIALELARRAPRAICLALHPGTVDTDLSRPFQGSVPDHQLFEPRRAAEQLLDVIDACGPRDSGRFLAWDGQEIPW